MKKTLYIIGLILLVGTGVHAQSNGTINQLNPWKVSGTTITPVKSTNSLTVPQLGGDGTKCLHVDNNGLFSTATSDCGTGGGGSGGGTWSTTTSTVSGQLFNYSNNATDIITIGSNSSTTAEFFFDPNTNLFKTVDIVTKSPYVDARYYSSLSAAITAIGSTATSTLVVPNTQNVTSNLTVPANITLKVMPGGMLNLSNGVTLTILGQIDAGFYKIFNNAINYVATTSFSGNYLQARYQTAWWGTPNDWTNDATPYLQAALDAVPIFGTLYYPNGQKMLLNSTLHLDRKANVTFTSDPQPNTVTPNYGIKWNGPNGSPMLTIHRTASSRVVNHTFIASTTSTAAGMIIDIDGESPEPGYTTTDNWIVGNMMPSNPASTTFKAISISEDAITNNEFMRIIDNKITGAGTYQGVGIYMGDSSNAHGHTIEGNTIYSFQYGLHSVNGSFAGRFNNFGGNDYDLYIENVSYPSVFDYLDSENSRHFAYFDGNTYPITISNSRLMGPGYAGDGFIVFGPLAKYIELRGNIYGGDSSAYTYDASGANNLKLTSVNNRFASSPAKTEAEHYHGFYPPVQGAVLTRNDPGYYTATSTTWANQQIVRDATLSYPNPGLNAGDIHLSPSAASHASNNSNSITFGANSSGYYDQAVAGIYVQTTQNPPTNSTMYFGTTNSYTVGPQIGMTLSPTRYLGIGTTSPYAKLSVVGQTVAAYFTATTSTASTFPYASTTALTVSGTASTTNLIISSLGGASTRCLQVGTDGTVSANASACGSGGGSGGGTWSTTTSTVSGQLVNYPNNTTDIVNIGSNSTTTGLFWFDPNRQVGYIKRLGVNQNNPSATYSIDVTGGLRTTGTAVLGAIDVGSGWAKWEQGATGGIGLGSGHNIAWKNTTTNTSNTGDVGLTRMSTSSLLVNAGSSNTFGTLVASSTATLPPVTSGLKIYTNPESGFSYSSVGAVLRWKDISGNANDLTQTQANADLNLAPFPYPFQSTGSSGINGGVGFNETIASPSKWYLSLPSTLSLNSKSMSVFVVARPEYNNKQMAVFSASSTYTYAFPSLVTNMNYNSSYPGAVALWTGTTSTSYEATQDFGNSGIQMFGFSSGASYTTVYHNGAQYIMTPLTSTTTNGGYIGTNNKSNDGFAGQIYEVLVYNRQLTTSEVIALRNFFANKYGSFNQTDTRVVLMADSLTEGYGLQYGENSYPNMLAENRSFEPINIALSGSTASGWNNTYTNSTAIPKYVDGKNNIAVVLVGSNDIQSSFGSSGTLLSIRGIGTKLRNKGFKTIFLTIPRRGTFDASMETDRQTVNQTMRTYGDAYWDYLIDLDNDPIFASTTITSNTEYFQSDTTHPTAKTLGIMKNYVEDAINKMTNPTTFGAFGVGTSTPSSLLAVHANASSTRTSLFSIASSTLTSTSTLLNVSNIGSTTLLSLKISQLANPAGKFLAVDSNGDVIGTTTPSGGGGSGTVNSGTALYSAYYQSTGTTIDATSTLRYTALGTVGIGTDAFTSLGGLSGQLSDTLDISGNTISCGSDNGLMTRTNSTAKTCAVAVANYGTSNLPFYLLRGVSDTGGNTVSIGGGSSVYPGSTITNFYLGDSITQVNPALVMTLNQSAGLGKNVGIGTSTPYAKLSVVGEVAARNFTATSTILNTFPYASSTAISSGYASSTILMTTGHQVYSTFDKSLWTASSTLDAQFNSFNTATSTWIVWNPSVATGGQSLYCKTDVGTATIEMGNGTASTTALCSSSGTTAASSVTWSARQDVIFAIKTTSGSPNKVTATGTFYAQ